MVGVGWLERSVGQVALATLDVRPPSVGPAARGPADSYALEVEIMVVIGERRPGTHHRRLCRRRSTATNLAAPGVRLHGTLTVRSATRLVPHAT
jgi:hypothetical protein